MACCGGRKESDVSQHGRAIYDLTKKKKKKNLKCVQGEVEVRRQE